MAESFSREEASTAEGRWVRNPVRPFSCVTPAGTSTCQTSRINGKTTHTHTHRYYFCIAMAELPEVD